MSENIKRKISSIIEKYKDPYTGKYFNLDDPELTIIVKDGHVDISIEIVQSHLSQYLQIKGLIEKDIKEVQDILSTNVILTSERKNNQHKKPETRFKINANSMLQ